MLGAPSVLAMHEADSRLPPKNTATICGGFRKQTCFLSSEEIFFLFQPWAQMLHKLHLPVPVRSWA